MAARRCCTLRLRVLAQGRNQIHSLPQNGENEEGDMSAPATTPISAAATQQPYDVGPRVDEAFAEDGFAKVDNDGDIARVKDKVVAKPTAVIVSEATANNND